MENSNRGSKVLANAKISLLFFLILLLLNFISRSVFIKYLGPEILGLNTIATNLVGFLNLAELGISAAIASSLYKPLSENNQEEIREIITLQGWLYRNIAYFIIVGAGILMCFFPIIFEKTQITLWYAYSIFLVLLASSLLTYFLNYKQVLLIAEMKEYKIILSIRTVQILKIMLQIFAIIYFKHGFIYWILLELVYGVSSSFILKKIIEREYPWLNIDVSKGRGYRVKHPNIITHTKQLFFHKISGFVLLQTTPLIIFAYASLTMVSMYDNYMMIILGITTLISAIFSSFQPAIGNLVANAESSKVLSFFYEYAVLRYLMAAVICVVFYFQAHYFITLWLGDKYIIPNDVFIFMVVYLFITLTRVLDPFVYAFALYGDIYAPMLEAIINLSLSIVLGYFFGLEGILSGVIISLFLVIFIWKPYYIFLFGFKSSVLCYFRKIAIYISCIALSTLFFYFTVRNFNFNNSSWLYFFISSMVIFVLYSIIAFIVFYIFLVDFRKVFFRVKNVLLKK